MTFKEYITNDSVSLDATDLYIYNIGLKDLYGIEKYTKLEQLYCQYNNIVDLTPLAGLNNLSILNCSNNKICDINPLVWGLNNLQQLSCTNNKIKDISGLKYLKKLVFLNISDNYITNIEVITNFDKLNILSIENLNLGDEFNEYTQMNFCPPKIINEIKKNLVYTRRKRIISHII